MFEEQANHVRAFGWTSVEALEFAGLGWVGGPSLDDHAPVAYLDEDVQSISSDGHVAIYNPQIEGGWAKVDDDSAIDIEEVTRA